MLTVIVLALGAGALAAAVTITRARPTRPFPPVVELAHADNRQRLLHKASELSAQRRHPRPVASPRVLSVSVQPGADASPSPAIEPTPLSVYQTHESPYAASVVNGSLISLPGADDSDLPIAFRSQHPDARAIVEAGDSASKVRVAAPDGRIHFGNAPGSSTL